MSQLGDYDLANQSGAAFRAELNQILSDVRTMNSGNSSPSVAVVGELFYNTTNDVVSICTNASGPVFVDLFDATNQEWTGVLGTDSVGSAQISNNAVTTSEIQNAQVTFAKLGTDAGNARGVRTVQTESNGTPTGGNLGDIVYQY